MTREEARLYIIRHCNPDYPKGKTEWERAVNMAIKALEQPEPQWIPCSERLPQKDEQVLCCNKRGSVYTSAYTYTDSRGVAAFGHHLDVIAWMPLPESYSCETESRDYENKGDDN